MKKLVFVVVVLLMTNLFAQWTSRDVQDFMYGCMRDGAPEEFCTCAIRQTMFLYPNPYDAQFMTIDDIIRIQRKCGR